MIFLLDENFPKSIKPVLENLGHRVLDFRELGVEGAPDKDLLDLAISEKALVLTTDRDFFHTLGRQNPEHHGIVVVALKRPTRQSIEKRISWFLDNIDPGNMKGRSFQLRDRTWIVYPAL